MSEGLLGAILIRKIANYEEKQNLNRANSQLFDITKCYLEYIKDKPQDQNSEVEEHLDIMLEHIFKNPNQ